MKTTPIQLMILLGYATGSEVFVGTDDDRDALRDLGLIEPKGPTGIWGLSPAGEEHVVRINEVLAEQGVEVNTRTIPRSVELARQWLANVKLEHFGYAGEHDEGGAAFRLGGVRFNGPSSGSFMDITTVQQISGNAVYNLFAEELVARWNRGPVEEITEA